MFGRKSYESYNEPINNALIFESLNEICEKYSIMFDWLPDEYYDTVITIFNGNRKMLEMQIKEFDNSDILNIFALYHFHVTLNYGIMKKCLRRGIELNSDVSMILMAYYYNHFEVDYRIVTKYYQKAMDMGNVKGYIGMADYWFNAGFDDEKGEEILLNFIDDNLLLMKKGRINAMLKLAQFYNNKKDGANTIKFIILALKCNDDEINYENIKIVENSLKVLKSYYRQTPDTFKDLISGFENPNRVVMNELNNLKLC